MLMLRRKPGEAFMIDTAEGTVVVRLVRWERGAMQMAVEAPQSVRIHREELLLKPVIPSDGD